mgnify:CR=1 FL=1
MTEEKECEENLSRDELLKRVEWYEKRFGPSIEKRGIHNWKNLFKKPTVNELMILFMLIMGGFVAWAYQRDVALCKEAIIQAQAFWIR